MKRVWQNFPLSSICTYRVGGRANQVVSVFDIEGLKRALEVGGKRLIIGRGSKLLFSDSGFDGTVILMRMDGIRFFKTGVVYCEAGVYLPLLSKTLAARGLSGLEWASGIPGTIGGSLKMNAGAHGSDMSRIVLTVDVLRNGSVLRIPISECGFSYRRSGFFDEDIIVGCVIKLEGSEPDKVEALRRELLLKRSKTQPSGFSCGSIFKSVLVPSSIRAPEETVLNAEKRLAGSQEAFGRLIQSTQASPALDFTSKAVLAAQPEYTPAWKFIDECGLRGLTQNGAQISTKHTNFIINKGVALAKDIMALIRTAKAEVYTKFGVKLEEEVIYAGDFK